MLEDCGDGNGVWRTPDTVVAVADGVALGGACGPVPSVGCAFCSDYPGMINCNCVVFLLGIRIRCRGGVSIESQTADQSGCPRRCFNRKTEFPSCEMTKGQLERAVTGNQRVDPVKCAKRAAFNVADHRTMYTCRHSSCVRPLVQRRA